MHQWFATGNYGNSAREFFCFANHIGYCLDRVRVGIPTFFHVAPNASYITASKSNKVGCFSLVKTFSLDGVKGFHQRQSGTMSYDGFCNHS